MTGQLQSLTCQRCGSGFVWTSSYRDLLARRGTKVVVPMLCPTCYMTRGPMKKLRGEVKWFSAQKHYGFILSETGEEVFFHEQQLVEENSEKLQKGQPVRFHPCYPIKGPEARNVELLGD